MVADSRLKNEGFTPAIESSYLYMTVSNRCVTVSAVLTLRDRTSMLPDVITRWMTDSWCSQRCTTRCHTHTVAEVVVPWMFSRQ